MQLLLIMLVVSGFTTGLTMAFFPDISKKYTGQSSIWAFAFSAGAYLAFLSIDVDLPDYVSFLVTSLFVAVTGYALGWAIRNFRTSKLQEKKTSVVTSRI